MTAIVEHKPARGRMAAIGIAAALTAFTAVSASALPIGAMGASAGQIQAATLPVENVRCGRGCAIGAGVAAGVVAGAVIANQAQRNYYDSGPVYYGGGYGPPRSNRCWVETNPYRGTGYWARC